MELDTDIFKSVTGANIIKIKDKSSLEINLEVISTQNSLKGIFVKTLLEKAKQEPENKEKIKRAIEVGLSCF